MGNNKHPKQQSCNSPSPSPPSPLPPRPLRSLPLWELTLTAPSTPKAHGTTSSPRPPFTPTLLKLSKSSETVRLRPGSLPKPSESPPVPLPSLPRKYLLPNFLEETLPLLLSTMLTQSIPQPTLKLLMPSLPGMLPRKLRLLLPLPKLTLSEVPTSLLLHLVELTRPPLLKHSSLLIKPLLVPPLPLSTLKRWLHSELLPLMSPTLLLALTKMPRRPLNWPLRVPRNPRPLP